MDKELKMIEDIDRKLDEIVTWFIFHFTDWANPRIKSLVLRRLEAVDFMDKSVKARLLRQRQLNRLRTILSREIEKEVLGVSADELVIKYKELVEMANVYFSTIAIGYQKKAYSAVYKDSLLILKDTLGGRGFAQKLVNDMVNQLVQLNMRRASRAALTDWVTEYLKANGQATRYAGMMANDTLYTLTRIVQNRVSEDLKIGYWLYAGTLIKTSRTFCRNKTGRAYTTDEVKKWAGLDWSGKISGTNATNIFERVGGYGCRHTLRPITKRVYDLINKRYEDSKKAA